MINFQTEESLAEYFIRVNQILDVDAFSTLDIAIAETVADLLNQPEHEATIRWIAIATAICHHQMRLGHTHLDLHHLPDPFQDSLSHWPNPDFWINTTKLFITKDIILPIVLEANRYLYIRKMWNAETDLIKWIQKERQAKPTSESTALNQSFIRSCAPEQAKAINAILSKQLILLSGGPGTGKTFTVLRAILNILTHKPESSIALVAPTGKAVARLTESISKGISELTIDDSTQTKIPHSAQTIHRFLRSIKPSLTPDLTPQPEKQFDWLFIDEVSMVDLALMSKLLNSIPEKTKVFMLGDVNQLASVQPGAVFSDLYRSVQNAKKDMNSSTSIELTQAHRFSEHSALNDFCEAVKIGAIEKVFQVLEQKACGITWLSPQTEEASKKIETHFQQLITQTQDKDARHNLTQVKKTMLLSPLNKGPLGVETLNHTLRKHAYESAYKNDKPTYWVPVIITENDYESELFNGDIGIQECATNRNSNEGFTYFETTEGMKNISNTLLPRHNDAFALTVHKSQGSEANDVILIIPEAESPILTKELFYTAISRAKNNLTIIGEKSAIEKAVLNPTQRNSRLSQKL